METDNPKYDKAVKNLLEQASQEIVSWWPNGQRSLANYHIGGEIVWQRSWNEAGQMDMERGFQNNVAHGPQRYWHDNGQLNHESFFVQGKEHGVARQYDPDGNLIGTYTMHHGTGLDLWYQEADTLSEERQYLESISLGY